MEARKDDSLNQIFDPEGVFQELFQAEPVIQRNAPPGMPSIKKDMDQINEVRKAEGLSLLANSTQGDSGEAKDDFGRQPSLSYDFQERESELENELFHQINETCYVGTTYNKAIREAAAHYFGTELPEPAVGLGGREVLYALHRAAYDITEKDPSNALPAMPAIEWSGYGQVALGDKTPFRYRSDGFVRVPLESDGMMSQRTFESALRMSRDAKRDIAYLTVASPGNPGLALTHERLVELVRFATQERVPILYDNFYGPVAPGNTLDVPRLMNDLTEQEKQHLMILVGTTKFVSSAVRAALLVALSDEGLANGVVRSTRAQVSGSTNNYQPQNMAGLITFLEQGRDPQRMTGAFGRTLNQRREEIANGLRDNGVPFITSNGYYFFAHVNPKGLSARDSYAELGVAYAGGNSFCANAPQFGRLSASTNKETAQAIASIDYDKIRK